LWNGPKGFQASSKQVDFENVQPKDTGTYKATLKNTYFNFHLKLVKDSISPFIKVNSSLFNYSFSTTVVTGDTVVLSPVPPDSVGWNWSWTGPGGYSARSRTVKIIVNDTVQAGNYISYGTDPFGCGTISQVFKLTVKQGKEIPLNADSIKIYPNPSSNGIFNLKNCGRCKISVYTLRGALIMDYGGNADKNVVDLSKQPAGIYLIRFSSDKKSILKKVIIQ
jgi:hypothetical protein